MAYDILAMRRDGFSDENIFAALRNAPDVEFDLDKMRKDGYSPASILDAMLASPALATAPVAAKVDTGPSPLDTALAPYRPAEDPFSKVKPISPVLAQLAAPTPQKIVESRTSPFAPEYTAALFAQYNLASSEERKALEAQLTPEGHLHRTIAADYAAADAKGPLGQSDMRIENRAMWWEGQGAKPDAARLAAKREILSGVTDPLDQTSISESEALRDRTGGEVVEDLAIAAGKSGAVVLKSASWLAQGFGAWDVGTTQYFEDKAAKFEAAKSDPLKFKKFLADMNSSGFLDTVRNYGSDPALLADMAADNVAMIIPGMLASRAAYATKLASAGALTPTAAHALAQTAATRAGMATNALLEGADAGQQAHERVDKMSHAELAEKSKTYREAVAAGATPEEAKHKVKMLAGWASFTAQAILSTAATKVTGAGRYEAQLATAGMGGKPIRSLTGPEMSAAITKAAQGILIREPLEETIQEGGATLTSNRAAQIFADPTIDIFAGVPKAAAMGTLMGPTQGAMFEAFGATAGLLQTRPSKDEALAAQLNVSPQQLADAISANLPIPGPAMQHGAPLQPVATQSGPIVPPAPVVLDPVAQVFDPNVTIDQQLEAVDAVIGDTSTDIKATMEQSIRSLNNDDVLDIPEFGPVRVHKDDVGLRMSLQDGTLLDDAIIGRLLSDPNMYTVMTRAGQVTEGGANVLQQRADLRDAELVAESDEGQGVGILGGVGVSGTAPLSSGTTIGGDTAGVVPGGGQVGPVRTPSVADQAVVDVERVAREGWAATDTAAEIAAAEAAAIMDKSKAVPADPVVVEQVVSTLKKPLNTGDSVVVVPASEIVKFAVITEGDRTLARIATDQSIRESIAAEGYDSSQPIEMVVDRNTGQATIKDGSHRAVIAAEMGISVPVVVRSGPIGRKQVSSAYSGELDTQISAPAVSAPAVSAPADVVPTTQMSPALPRDLADAKPRYAYKDKMFELEFDNDIDRAAYIASGEVKSKRDQDYVDFVVQNTNMAESDVRELGVQIRSQIKTDAATSEPGTLIVPRTYQTIAPVSAPVSAPVVSRSTSGNVVLTPAAGVESFTADQVTKIRTQFGGIANGPVDARSSITLPKTVDEATLLAAMPAIFDQVTPQVTPQVGPVTLSPSRVPQAVMSTFRGAIAGTEYAQQKGINVDDIQLGTWESLPAAETTEGVGRDAGKMLSMVVKTLTDRDVVFFSGPVSHEGAFIAGPATTAKTLFVNANRVVTNPLATLGHEWLHSLKQSHPAIYKRLRDVVMGQNPDMLAMYRDYNQLQPSTARMTDDEINALLSDPTNAAYLEEELMADLTGNRFKDVDFWNEFFAEAAAKQGKSGARLLADQLLRMLRELKAVLKGEGYNADQFVKDIAEVEAAVKQAIREYMTVDRTMAAQAAPMAPQVGEVRAAPRRGGETVGEFAVKTFKDGSLLVSGDAASIRAAVPSDVRGREVTGGVQFTHSTAPRVRAALEGRSVAYSRAGVVTEKLPVKDGIYIGAPEKYNTPAKIPTLRKQMLKLTHEGAPGRYWYENSSEEVLRLVGGSVHRARKLAALLSIYSPQAKVDGNGTFAIRAWAQHEAGHPINVKSNVSDTKANDALRDVDAYWSGEKTGNFVTNLLRKIDPSLPQGATIDMWMMRAAEYTTDAPSSTQYAFMENEVNRIARDLGWEPQQVQAAIWVAMKARMENPSVKSATEALSEKKGWIRFDQHPKNGRTRVVIDAAKHRANWIKHALAHKVTEADTQRAKFDFGDALRRHIGQVSWEARPSVRSGVLPGIHKASYAVQLDFQQAVQKAFYGENGEDLLAVQLGLLVDRSDIAPGVWEHYVSPSQQLDVVMAPQMGGGKVDPAQANLLNVYAAIKGLLTAQDGVGWHRPFYTTTKTNANGLDIDLGRSITPEEARDVEAAVDQWMTDNGKQTFVNEDGETRPWADAFAIISSHYGVRLLNFGVVSNKQLQKDILAAVETVLPEGEHAVFMSDGELVTNDWKENQNGQTYIQRISAEGSSDVLGWSREFLAPRVQRVFDEYAERYEWGNSAIPRFSPARGGSDAGRGGHYREGVRQDARPVYGTGIRQAHSLSIVGVHYSPEPQQVLVSSLFGKGAAGEERARVFAAKDKRLHNRTYFYANAGTGVHPEAGVGSYPHTVQLDNIYDGEADPLFLEQYLPSGLSTADQRNAFESAVIDAGFDGYINKFGNDRAIVLLGWHSVKVRQEAPGESVDVPLAPRSETNPYIAAHTAFVANRSMPAGQMTGARWKRLLATVHPDMTVDGLLDEDMYYRDAVASVAFRKLVPAKSDIRLSPSRSGAIVRDRATIAAKVAELENMTTDQRENIDPYDFGYVYYLAHEAKKMMPKKEGTMKMVNDRNSFALYQDADALANINGEPWLVTKQDDPDDDNDEGLYVWAFEDPMDPDNKRFSTATGPSTLFVSNFQDKLDAIADFKAALAKQSSDIRLSPVRSGAWYSSKLADAIQVAPEKVFRSGPQVKVWLQANAGKLGVKADEIQWSGINEWLELASNVTKADVAAYLEKGGVQVHETELRDPEQIDLVVRGSERNGYYIVDRQTGEDYPGDFRTEESAENEIESLRKHGGLVDTVRYDTWQLPGGKDYRELLLTLPTRMLTGRKYASPHFKQDNILAHVRFNERTDADGKRVLFIEEIQSDWAQHGRKTGFGRVPGFRVVFSDGAVFGAYTNKIDAYSAMSRANSGVPRVEQAVIVASKDAVAGTTPAPFVTDTKAWVGLAVKRMIRYATDGGYDKMAFITGEQSAARYDLGKVIDYIEYEETDKGEFYVRATDHRGGHPLTEYRQTAADLEQLFGKEISKKIVNHEGTREPGEPKLFGTLRTADLRVGGEGMAKFYDEIVPNVVKAVLRQVGASDVLLKKVMLNTSDKQYSGKYEVYPAGGTESIAGPFNTSKEAEQNKSAPSDEVRQIGETAQNGFEITDSLRGKVAEGIPLFSPSRERSDAYTEALAKKFAAAVAKYDQSTLPFIEQALVERVADFEAARGDVASNETTREVGEALASRAGWSMEDFQKFADDIKGDVPPHQIFAAALATFRVNVAEVIAAKDAADFVKRTADVMNFGMWVRLMPTEAGRILQYLGAEEKGVVSNTEAAASEKTRDIDDKADKADKAAEQAVEEAQQAEDKITAKDGGAFAEVQSAKQDVIEADRMNTEANDLDAIAKDTSRQAKEKRVKAKSKSDPKSDEAVIDNAIAENLEIKAEGAKLQAAKLRSDAAKLRTEAKSRMARATAALEKAKLKMQDAEAWMADATRLRERANKLAADAAVLRREAIRAREQARRDLGRSMTSATKARLAAQKANAESRKLRYAITEKSLIDALGGMDEIQKILDTLQKQGHNVNMDAIVKLFQGMAGAQLKSAQEAESSGALDKINNIGGGVAELFKANILSGIVTHAVNIIGTTSIIAAEVGLVRTLASLMPGDVGIRQHINTLRGLNGVLADAIAVAKFAALSEYQGKQLIRLIKMTPRQQKMVMELTKNKWLDNSKRYIPGAAGRFVRLSLAALGIEDSFLKTLPYRYSLAVQEASGKPVDYKQAVAYAELLTLQAHGGHIAGALTAVTSAIPAIGIVVPFVTTLINLLKFTSRYIPGLGAIDILLKQNALGKVRIKASESAIHQATMARNDAIARAIIGGVIGLAAIMGAGDDDDDFSDVIAPLDRQAKAVWMQEHGVLAAEIDGKLFHFNRLDPFASSAAVTMASVHAFKLYSEGKVDEANRLVAATAYQYGFGRMPTASLGALITDSAQGDTKALARYRDNILSSIAVPRWISQFGDWMDKPRQAEGLVETIQSRLPFVRESLHERLDLYGEPATSTTGIPSPVGIRESRPDPLNNWLLKLGRGLDPAPTSLDGLSIEMKKELLRERHDLLTEAMRGTEGWTREEKRDLVTRELGQWTRYYVNPARDDAGLEAKRKADADVID